MKGSAGGGPEPVRRKVVVAASPDVAFQRFTAEMAEWWPMADFSVHGAGGTVEFGESEGEEIVERGPEGEAAVWGTVLEWDPPRKVRFTWHPGRDAGAAQEVEVTFLSTGESTEVSLVHGGWDASPEGRERRGRYEAGWERVLGAYRESV
ncbi:MAG: SRPBCC domain-containing protein [Gemmatimonadetes bacterium]|nr:SRPBCC domain-containing protein [Gemmatimonadota bacterium]